VKSTVNTATVVVTVPPAFVITHWYWCPFKNAVVLAIVRFAVAEPDILPPSVRFPNENPLFVDTCHWYVTAGLPVATTEIFAALPAVTVVFAGSVVMPGGVCTVKTAAVLFTVPRKLYASSWYSFPDFV
jgi:hypothetical protein